MTLLQVGEIVRIGDVPPSGGDDEIGVPAQLPEAVREAFDLGDAREDVEHPSQDEHRAGGVLADHVEHGVAQAVVIGHGMDQDDPPLPDDRPGRR